MPLAAVYVRQDNENDRQVGLKGHSSVPRGRRLYDPTPPSCIPSIERERGLPTLPGALGATAWVGVEGEGEQEQEHGRQQEHK